MTLKILLTADLHIGKKYGSYPHNIREDLANARFEVLETLVEKANENNCDIFVIAGDLFDVPNFLKRNVKSVASYLERFEGKAILILPGNHDHFSPNSENRWDWVGEIDKVFTLTGKEVLNLSKYLEEGKETKIYPAPCDSKHSEDNRINWIKETEKDPETKYHIGIAHGHLDGCSYDRQGVYFPMSREELKECGMDLWLLGHVHVVEHSCSSPDTNYFYPGTPEQDGFKKLATGSEKGKAWILDMEDGELQGFSKIDVGKYNFTHKDVRLEDSDDIERFRKYLEREEHSNTLIKINIGGRLNKGDFKEVKQHIDELKTDHGNFKFAKVDDEDLKKRIDVNVITEEFPEESFYYQLLQGILEKDDERSETAAELAYDILKEG